MTARTALAILILGLPASLNPTFAVGQESDESDAPVSAPGSKEKVNPTLSRVDSIFEKTAGALASLERCVNMKSDLSRQLPPAAAPGKAEAGKATFVELPNPGAVRANRLAQDCGPEVPIEQTLKNKDLARLDNDNPIPSAASAYFLCVAVAKKDDASCDALAGIPDFEPGTYWDSSIDLCKGFYRRLFISKALISREPSARQLCLKRGKASETARESECDLLLKAGADLKGVCEKAAGAGSEREACERNAGAYWGLAPRCDPADIPMTPDEKKKTRPSGSSKGVSPATRAQCLVSNAAAAFRKAYASGAPEGCGGDGLCLAMMGGGVKACSGYAAQVQAAKKDYCPRAGSGMSAAEAAEMEKEQKVWEAETKRKTEELKRKAEDDKRAMDAASTRRSQAEAQAAAVRSKIGQLDTVCAKLEVEGQEAMARLLTSIEGIEPKSLSGFKRRVERFNSVKSQWNSLQQKLHPQAPRAKR